MVRGGVLGVTLALSILVAGAHDALAAPPETIAQRAGIGPQGESRHRFHVIQPGESLWTIAERELGDGSKWPLLYRLNRDRIGPSPRRILPGMRLALGSGTAVGSFARRYRVKPGDSLWTIAERRLGAGERWKRLYELNREAIGEDPRRIMPGTILVLRDGLAPRVAEVPMAPKRHVVRKRPSEGMAKAPPPAVKPVAKAPPPAVKPVAKAPPPAAKPVAKAPPPAAKPVAKAPPPAAKPVAKAPPPAAKPVAKAPPPAAKPVAKAPPAEIRNPFQFDAGSPGQVSRPDAAGTPPGRNPFAFGGDGSVPDARTVQGEAQRRVGGMPVVPNYPEEGALAGRKGKAPVAVDVKGGKAVARKKGRKHMASSPGPRTGRP